LSPGANIPLSVGEEHELLVERLTLGGDGVSRHHGFVIFTPFVLPGERVLVTVFEIKKKFARARLQKVIETSPNRIEPKCSHFTLCGGCSWQHITYEGQVQLKLELFSESLSRAELFPERPATIVPCQEPWHYRNRIELSKRGAIFGFHELSSDRVFEPSECPVASKRINSVLSLRSYLEGRSFSNERLHISEDGEGRIRLRGFTSHSQRPEFTQVNNEQNDNLKEHITKIVCESPAKEIIDLFCGAGNFSLELARLLPTERVVGIDNNKKAIASAQKQAERLGLSTRCRFYCRSVTKADLQGQGLVLVDPPRRGLEASICKTLGESPPQSLIYISCNPITLVRDLKIILASGHLKLRSAKVFDMFPQTSHMESVVHLSR
jgi:23S rRNA (uracil1939-C5)-methyltransferase